MPVTGGGGCARDDGDGREEGGDEPRAAVETHAPIVATAPSLSSLDRGVRAKLPRGRAPTVIQASSGAPAPSIASIADVAGLDATSARGAGSTARTVALGGLFALAGLTQLVGTAAGARRGSGRAGQSFAEDASRA